MAPDVLSAREHPIVRLFRLTRGRFVMLYCQDMNLLMGRATVVWRGLVLAAFWVYDGTLMIYFAVNWYLRRQLLLRLLLLLL